MSTTGEFPCPWCDEESESRNEFRVHLMVDHRKRKLAEFVADRVEAESAADREADPIPA